MTAQSACQPPPRALARSTLACNCLTYLALAFTRDIYLAFLVRLIGGMAAGNGSVVQGYIADVTPPELRAGHMAKLGAAYNIGFIVGPFIGGVLARPSAGPIGFQIPLLCTSVLCGLSAWASPSWCARAGCATRSPGARPTAG